ncbi:MAG: hypothetical protein GX242_06650 [Clostridiales bacterium]|nr:hypothetical protein [Clostridiales bacterium]
MNLSKIKSYVGFAIKMGKAVFGVDTITTLRRPPKIVLYDHSLSTNSEIKLTNYTARNNIVSYKVAMEEIYPEKNCKAIGILHKNLALAIDKSIKESLE